MTWRLRKHSLAESGMASDKNKHQCFGCNKKRKPKNYQQKEKTHHLLAHDLSSTSRTRSSISSKNAKAAWLVGIFGVGDNRLWWCFCFLRKRQKNNSLAMIPYTLSIRFFMIQIITNVHNDWQLFYEHIVSH